MPPTVRPLRPADLPAAFALRAAAFSPEPRVDPPEGLDRWYAAIGDRVGVDDDGELVGHATCWPFGMWLRGRRVPTQGVASLTIAAHRRRAGLGALLVRALLQRAVDRGEALSALYPTTAGLYARHGYAVAGTRTRRTVPTALLAALPPPGRPLRMRLIAFPDDIAAISAVQRRDAARAHGRLDRDRVRTANMWAPHEDTVSWVAEHDGQLVGAIHIARASTGPGDASIYEQRILDVAAADHDVRLALLRLAGDHAASATWTRYCTGPDDMVLDHWTGPSADLRDITQHWMARVVDVAGIVDATGWSADLDLVLRITDDVLPSVDGTWQVRVEAGRGTTTRVEHPPGGCPTLDVGGFSQMVTGWSTASSLAARGRLVGASGAQLDALDAALRSPAPVMHDYF